MHSLTQLLASDIDSQVQVILRPTVSRPVRLGVGPPSRAHDQILLSSLMRRWVCNLLVQFFVTLQSKSYRAHIRCLIWDYWVPFSRPLQLAGIQCRYSVTKGLSPVGLKNILSQFLRLPQPGGPGLHIYIPQEQGGPDKPPGTGFPFRCLLRLAGLQWRYSIPPPHGMTLNSDLSLYGLCTDHTENISTKVLILLRAWLLQWLPNNNCCLQSHYLVTAGVQLL
jgi:hypothetical protein